MVHCLTGAIAEHWLGTHNIHVLSNQDLYSLRVELTDWNRQVRVAEYSSFLVTDEQDGYRMFVSGFSGDAGDGLSNHHGFEFKVATGATDTTSGSDCVPLVHGAWWESHCGGSNLNGKYYKDADVTHSDRIVWKTLTLSEKCLKKVEMKIRPRNADDRLLL